MHERMSMRRTSGRIITHVLLITLTAAAIVGAGVFSLRPAAYAALRHTTPPPDIAAMTTKLNDLDVTVHVNSYDPKELEKIGKDFARTYALHTLTMLYKQPDKMRLDGTSTVLGDAMLIQNGAIRYYSVPKLKLHNREDLKNSPGKRQSLLEYCGLITPTALTFMQAHYIQHEDPDGVETQVFDMTYKGATANSHYRIWVDAKTNVTLKRVWYDSENKLKATFYYQEPHEVSPGIWLPTRIEVKNAAGVSAAVTTLEDPQVNQGLSDDLFNVTP